MLESIFYGYEGGGLHREILQRCVAVKEYPHLQENRVMFPDVMLRDPPAKTSRWLLAVAAAASALMLNRSPGKLEDGGGGWTSDGRTDQSADDEEGEGKWEGQLIGHSRESLPGHLRARQIRIIS